MRIFYGVNGEGLGHASRTLSVVDQLTDCDVHIFTYGAAYHYLKKTGYPHLHRVDGLMFSYRKQRVDYLRSLGKAAYFYWTGLKSNIEQIRREAKRLQPRLFVSDFEPSIARAAHVCHRSLVSVDNQHRFVHCRMTGLPRALRTYARAAAWATRLMVPAPDHVVIATFHTDGEVVDSQRVTLTPGLLRKAVEDTPVSNQGFLLAYLRPSVADAVLQTLVDCPRDVRVYGVADTPKRDYYQRRGIRLLPLSPSFVRDLASCDRLIGTAGNQLICEARYFRKPLLAIPEPRQYEQHINAWYVEHHQLGMQCPVERLSRETVCRFLSRGLTASPGAQNGVHQVVKVIRNCL